LTFPYNYLIDASRKAPVIVPNRVSSTDPEGSVRDLIVGDFVNWEQKPGLKRLLQENRSGFQLIEPLPSRNTGIQGQQAYKCYANFSL
jgi:Fe(3+) dicitrate transport protein